MDVSDADLLRQFADSRSHVAFAELVRRYVDLVFTAARRQVREANLAEDVTQQVFLVLARKAWGLRSETVLAAWLLGVVKHESRNALKRLARRQHHERSMANMMPPQTTTTPDEDAHWAEVEPLLDDALAGLNESDRKAVVLRFFQNKSHGEAAAILGISEVSARQRVFRGVEKLRSFFARRGFKISAGALSAGLAANAVLQAPAGLAAATVTSVSAAGTLAVSKGWLFAMASAKANSIAGVVIAAIIVIATSALIYSMWDDKPANQPRKEQVAAATLPATDPSRLDRIPDLAPDAFAVDPNFSIPKARGPRWADTPHELFHPIFGLSYDDKRGTRDGSDHIGFIDRGSQLRYDRVNLGTGKGTIVIALACPPQYAGQKILFHQDEPHGPVIGEYLVESTGGFGTFNTVTAPYTSEPGMHSVCLTFTGGGFNIRSFKICSGGRPAAKPIPADSYAEASGVVEMGGRIAWVKDGAWMRYGDIEFDAALKHFAVNYMYGINGAGTLTVRLDSLEGPVIAEHAIVTTGWGAYKTFHAELKRPVSGRHDVFVTLAGARGLPDLAWFAFVQTAPAPATRPSTQPAGAALADAFPPLLRSMFEVRPAPTTQPLRAGGASTRPSGASERTPAVRLPQ